MALVLHPVEPDELPATNVLLQTALWARLKSEFGWRALCFRAEVAPSTGKETSPLGGWPLVLLTRTLRGAITIGYLPYPLSSCTDIESVLQLPGALGNVLRPQPTFLRFDLAQDCEVFAGNMLDRAGFRKASSDVQPPSTVIVDLSPEDEARLSAMKPKTRYNIRLAGKKGVVVSEAGMDKLPMWYGLYQETARRDRIVLHSFDYYQRLFELAHDDPAVSVRLLIAEHDGDLLAGIVLALVGNAAVYLYGASSDIKRNLMASYAVQWRAMQLARECGCCTYDLFGIPPVEDPDHPMAGLYRFKTGFGGRIVHRPGCHDVPLQPIRYVLFSAAESLRYFYYKRLCKRF